MTISFSGGVQLSQGVNLAVTEYDPSFLYLLGGTGAWYDPSDLTTMYQDSSGTAPVTAAGQQVGLLLDKSQGLVLGPELVSNSGPFSATTGYAVFQGTLSASDENLVATATVANDTRVLIAVSMVVGQYYIIRVNVANSDVGNVILGGNFNSAVNFGQTIVGSSDSSGFLQLVVLATGTNFNLVLRNTSLSIGQSFSVSSVSAKLLPGNHATQTTAAQRPILGRNPITGTRNLLSYTEQFDNAYWNKTGVTISVNTAVAPDGTSTADSLVQDTNTGGHILQKLGAFVSGTNIVRSIYAKANTGSRIVLAQTSSSGIPSFGYIAVDLTNGSTLSILGVGGSVEDVGDGWYRITLNSVLTGAASDRFVVGIMRNTDTTPVSYTGDGSTSIYIWGAQGEERIDSIATSYQRVVSQYDVTESGVTDAYYLAFDGSDDWMITSTITPGIDKAQVFAGVRKLSDAARGILVELGSAPASNAINVSAPGGASATYSIGGGGSLFVGPISTSASYSAPITNVLAVTDDIAADNGSLRVNGGAAQQLLTTDQGTGNFAANPLYLGRRGGTTLPFNGRLYSLIVRFGGNLDSTTIQNIETWVNSKTGAY